MSLIERLRALKWMVNCEMRGMIPDASNRERVNGMFDLLVGAL